MIALRRRVAVVPKVQKVTRVAMVTMVVVVMTLGAATAYADTLVLLNGRSYTGELVSVRNGRIEFRTDRGRLERFSVDDVDRVGFFRGRNDFRDDRDRGNSLNDRPSGLREREIDVHAAAAWTPTNIQLCAGDELWFDSRGEIRWGPGRRDGPEGEGRSPRNPGRPIPSRPGASLIGKVGESGGPFFIGEESGPIQVRERGRLFLGINDDFLQDNSGSFRVVVYY